MHNRLFLLRRSAPTEKVVNVRAKTFFDFRTSMELIRSLPKPSAHGPVSEFGAFGKRSTNIVRDNAERRKTVEAEEVLLV